MLSPHYLPKMKQVSPFFAKETDIFRADNRAVAFKVKSVDSVARGFQYKYMYCPLPVGSLESAHSVRVEEASVSQTERHLTRAENLQICRGCQGHFGRILRSTEHAGAVVHSVVVHVGRSSGVDHFGGGRALCSAFICFFHCNWS